MLTYKHEKTLRACAYVLYTILNYAVITNIYWMLAEGVKIHGSKYFDGEELVTIYKISQQRCVCECNAKITRCASLNYNRKFTSCRLNVNKPQTHEELLDKPGSVFIEMDADIFGCDKYTIASNTDKSVVPFNQPACGKPPEKANATIMGNVYSNGSRIKYVCNERYKQLDQTKSVSTCLYNESWSHVNFTCKPDTIGKPCVSNQECLEQFSECKDDVCFCFPKHSYSLQEYACIPRYLSRGNYIISGSDVLRDDHFIASTSLHFHGPSRARLDSLDSFNYHDVFWNPFLSSKPRFCGCWASYIQDKEQFIQVNMEYRYSITAVTTKARDPSYFRQFVKSYKIKYSVDGVSFNPVLDHHGKDMIFLGNTLEEINALVTNELPCPIQAQYIRINPQDWYIHISLRFDVIGSKLQPADCDFENGSCGWQKEDGSVIQWQIGQLNNTEGGPVYDHTYSKNKSFTDPVTGTYMYIKINEHELGFARISVSIKTSNIARCLSLWYMTSRNYSGSLNVITAKCDFVIEKLKNTTNTDFSEIWNLLTVRVDSGVYQIVIEVIWTADTIGFVAIDDVKLTETDCS